MNRTKKAGLSVKSGLSLMCIVCLLCGLLCGFFWLAGENSALAAGPDGSALAAKAVVSGDASLAAPERGEKLAVQQHVGIGISPERAGRPQDLLVIAVVHRPAKTAQKLARRLLDGLLFRVSALWHGASPHRQNDM